MHQKEDTLQENQETAPQFSSQASFILTAAGSAIGLANLWKFPYIAFAYGGLNVLLPYFFFMIFVSIPLFVAETTIGAVTQKTPDQAFTLLRNGSRLWKWIGDSTIFTGFLISSFYSVVTGWILLYTVQAISKGFHFSSYVESAVHWNGCLQDWKWGVIGHTAVALLCLFILTQGVKKGLERLNQVCMPLFFVCIISLFIWSISLSGFWQAVSYLTSFQPTTNAGNSIILVALGHAFFTLSVGQGTLVTYGSYTKAQSTLFSSSIIIAFADTLISILSSVILIATVFSDIELNGTMTSGPSLLFEALPSFFSTMESGPWLPSFFFFFVFLAAITSQLSALEPSIRRIEAATSLGRKKSALLVIGSSWALGIIASISVSSFHLFSLNGTSWFDFISYVTTTYMLPLGAMAAAMLFLKAWHTKKLIQSSGEVLFADLPKMAQTYLLCSLKLAPIFILAIFIHALGIW